MGVFDGEVFTACVKFKTFFWSGMRLEMTIYAN